MWEKIFQTIISMHLLYSLLIHWNKFTLKNETHKKESFLSKIELFLSVKCQILKKKNSTH